MEKDVYDLEVERLTKNPEDIRKSWLTGMVLFKMIGSDINRDRGCLTQIKRCSMLYAYTNGVRNLELTDQIKTDRRLPNCSFDINEFNLPVFAEYQRKIDKLNSQ